MAMQDMAFVGLTAVSVLDGSQNELLVNVEAVQSILAVHSPSDLSDKGIKSLVYIGTGGSGSPVLESPVEILAKIASAIGDPKCPDEDQHQHRN